MKLHVTKRTEQQNLGRESAAPLRPGPLAAIDFVRHHPFISASALALVAGIVAAISIYIHYDRLVAAKLHSGPFANAANIYASPRTIAAGDRWTQTEMVAYLRRAGYSESQGEQRGTYRVRGSQVNVYPGENSYFRRENATVWFSGDSIQRITREGTRSELEAYSLEPELITNLAGAEREKRRLVEFKEIPKVLVDAVVSAEDKRFFDHIGLDPFRLVKAVIVDIREGRKEQGASTITMQLARGLWLEPEKKWRRKLTEILITAILEQRLTKQEIFTYYANQIYLGRQNTFSVHGFGEAARVYYNKDISQLTLPQAAMLAGLIQRPSYINPFRYEDRAIARRNTVLYLMHQNGYINAAEYEQAKQAPLGLSPARTADSDFPYFLALVNDELQERIPENSDSGSYSVYTTLDPDMQKAALEAIETGMARVDAQIKARKDFDGVLPQAALIALDAETGEVKAAVGGRDYAQSQLNHLLAMRQPGSAFKPFVYAAALASSKLTEATVIQDVPTTIRFGDEVYQPNNFEKTFHGPVSMRYALSHSLNVATVNLAQKVGYRNIVNMAKAAGLNNGLKGTPAVALGAYETTPLEIAGAYTPFANQGIYSRPTFIREVRRPDGKTVFEGTPDQHQAMDVRVAFMMRELMQEVIRSGTAASAWSLGLHVPAAGKTGTSRDGWFAGFTPKLICVVWVGFDDNRELDLEGARSALPIWAEFMKRVATEAINFPNPPSGLTSARVCAETGLLAADFCPRAGTQFFLAGTEPHTACEQHLIPADPALAGGTVLPFRSVPIPPPPVLRPAAKRQ